MIRVRIRHRCLRERYCERNSQIFDLQLVFHDMLHIVLPDLHVLVIPCLYRSFDVDGDTRELLAARIRWMVGL